MTEKATFVNNLIIEWNMDEESESTTLHTSLAHLGSAQGLMIQEDCILSMQL